MTILEEYNENIPETIHFSELIGKKVISAGKRIGRLSDLVIHESGSSPEITHLYINRLFGHRSFLIPWEDVLGIFPDHIGVSPGNFERFERSPNDDETLLRTYVVNRKVIDLEENEVRTVYDLILIHRFKKLLISEAEISNQGFLRRLGIEKLSPYLCGFGKDLEDTSIPWSTLQPLPTDGVRKKGDVKLRMLKEKLEKMHPVDLADIIEEMDPDQRVMIFSELDTSTASDTLEEIDPPIQREIVSSLKSDHVIDLIDEMTPGQTADILTALSSTDAKHILNTLSSEKAKKVRSILDRSEEVIENYTTSKFIMLPPDMMVGEVQDEYPKLAKGKDMIMYLYVADDSYVLHGVVDIKELLQADDQAKLIDIMIDDVITLTPESTLKEASEIFARYDFRALPVVDDEYRLVGVVPYRDVMRLKHHFID